MILYIENPKDTTRKLLELINEYRTTQNLWDTVKAVLRGKFIAIQAHLKKQEKKSNK